MRASTGNAVTDIDTPRNSAKTVKETACDDRIGYSTNASAVPERNGKVMLAQVTFDHGTLAQVRLYPVSLGYGDNLRASGTPRLESRATQARDIFRQITQRSVQFGLPDPGLRIEGNAAVSLRPFLENTGRAPAARRCASPHAEGCHGGKLEGR